MNEQIPKATFQNVKENLSRRAEAVTEAGGGALGSSFHILLSIQWYLKTLVKSAHCTVCCSAVTVSTSLQIVILKRLPNIHGS